MSPLQERIANALAQVINSRTGQDVLTAETVRDIGTTLDGKVQVTVVLDAADDATLVRDVRHALEGVDGVKDVRVQVADATERASAPVGAPARQAPVPAPDRQAPVGATPRPAPAGRAPLPMMEAPRPAAARPGVPPPVSYPHLGRILAVSSGKGGVGKSTVAVNLAVALAARGLRVGLMDADVYGPNVPRMMGVNAPPPVRNEKIVPLESFGVKVMSLGFMIERDQPAIWRGPIVMKIVTQFLRDVAWGTLDFFLVDMPPGTGDAQLSLVQATNVAGAIIVTTPQQVATGDALRGAKMFQRVQVPVLGIVENMSWFECPHCGKPSALFGSGGGRALADELGVELLAQIPLYPRVMEGGDTGRPIVAVDPDAAAARAISGLAERVLAMSPVP